MRKIDVLEYLVSSGPGCTEAELAKAIHGRHGYQQLVNQDLSLLVRQRKVERKEEPHHYFEREADNPLFSRPA